MDKRGKQLVTNSYPRDVVFLGGQNRTYRIREHMETVTIERCITLAEKGDTYWEPPTIINKQTGTVVLEQGYIYDPARVLLLMLQEEFGLTLPK